MRPDARAYERYMRRLIARGRAIVLTPYFGGKVRLSTRLLPLMPPLKHFVDAFGGSAAILLNRPRAEGREVYSDLNAAMVALMLDMRDDYERTLWRLRFTPYSRRAYGDAKRRLKAATETAGVDAHVVNEMGLNSKSSFTANHDPGNRAVSSGRRLGVDAFTLHRQSMHAHDAAGWGMKRDTEVMPVSSVAAKQVGVGVDALTVREQSMTAKAGSFGSSRDGEAIQTPKNVTVASRVGVDAATAHDQSHSGAGRGFKAQIDGDVIGSTTSLSIARRVGVDAATRFSSEMWGGGGETFGMARDGSVRDSLAVTGSNRLGLSGIRGDDVDVVVAQSHFASGHGWAVDKKGRWADTLKSSAEANRVGVKPERDVDFALPDGWDKIPAGYVVAESGVKSVEILLSYPPTRCETVNDVTGEIFDLFLTACEYPLSLWSRGARDVRSVADAVKLARCVIENDRPTVDLREQLAHWRLLDSTWYAAMNYRLKRSQIEDKPVAEVRERYAHPTSAQLTAVGGEREWLGYSLPISETPLTRVSERLQDVEIYHADAMDIIAEWRDEPDALLYLDPPYVHASRKGDSDYDHEMTDEQHRQMLELVKDARARVIISGYPNALYDSMLTGWRTEEFRVNASSALGKNGAGAESGRSNRIEKVWMNYNIDDWRAVQSALF